MRKNSQETRGHKTFWIVRFEKKEVKHEIWKAQTLKEEQSKRKGKISASKRKMIERSKTWKPNSSPDLREAYATKIEWVQKAIPKSK